VLNTPGREAELIRQAQQWLTVPEQFGVFCLCENARSRRMWNEYAEHGAGFVVAFNTRHPGFATLKNPGLIGPVEYGDEPIPSFLSAYGASSFFRKRERYRFESEWRSVRALVRFVNVKEVHGAPPIYLAAFNPACVYEILILARCSIELELRTLAAVDARYRHVSVNFIEQSDLQRP
jgi:hypothetical protein